MTANSPVPSRKMISANVATYQIVSRSRSRIRRWMPSRDDVASVAKAIPGAAYCLDQLDGEFVVDLPAQAAHQNLEHVGEGIVVFVPHMGGDCSAIHDLPVMQNEELEQRKLLGSQLDRFAGAAHSLCFQVDLEIGDTKRFRQRSSAAPGQRSHSRQQLAKSERLGEIIVGADFKAGNAIVDGVARSQHQNRRGQIAGTQLTAKVDPASARQHHVENDDVKSSKQRLHLSVGMVGDGYYLNAVLGEAGFDDSR